MRKEWFILACRNFNRGLAKLMLIKQSIEEEEFEEKEYKEE